MEQPEGRGARLDFMAAGATGTSSERAPAVTHTAIAFTRLHRAI